MEIASIRRVFALAFLGILALVVAPFFVGTQNLAYAQTKTCGTPGAPVCPGPAPIPGAFVFRSLTMQAYGGVTADSLGEAWAFTATVDQPNSNKCAPTGVSFSQPASSWGPTPYYMFSPSVLLTTDSWHVAFNSISSANPPPGEAPCIWSNLGGEEILASRSWSCPNGGSIQYTSSPQSGPACTTPTQTPDDVPGPLVEGSCPAGATSLGNPCEISNGNKYQIETDYRGPNGLTFTRSYNSLAAYRHYASSNGLKQRTPLGVAWSASFFQHIVEVPTTDSTGACAANHPLRDVMMA